MDHFDFDNHAFSCFFLVMKIIINLFLLIIPGSTPCSFYQLMQQVLKCHIQARLTPLSYSYISWHLTQLLWPLKL